MDTIGRQIERAGKRWNVPHFKGPVIDCHAYYRRAGRISGVRRYQDACYEVLRNLRRFDDLDERAEGSRVSPRQSICTLVRERLCWRARTVSPVARRYHRGDK